MKSSQTTATRQITAQSFRELMEILTTMPATAMVTKEYLLKRIIDHAKSCSNSDEVRQLYNSFVVVLLGGDSESAVKISISLVDKSLVQIKAGFMILRALAQKHENVLPGMVSNVEEKHAASIFSRILNGVQNIKDIYTIEIAIECLFLMRSSVSILSELYEKARWFTEFTERYILVISAKSQINLLSIWDESLRYEKFRDWLASEPENLKYFIICMQGKDDGVSLAALGILAMLSKYKSFLQEYQKNGLFETFNSVIMLPHLMTYRVEIFRKIALTMKNMIRFIIREQIDLNSVLSNDLLQNVIKLAKSSDEKTKLYAVTAIAYLSKKQEYISSMALKEASTSSSGGANKFGAREDILKEIYEVMTGLTQFMKQNKLNKQACKFLANQAKPNISFDHSIMAFLFNCLTSQDQDLQKYSVKALSCVKISQLSSKFIISLLHLLDMEGEKAEKVKEYASLTLAKISKDPAMQPDLVKEPEISSIKHALDLAKSPELILNLITVVGNLSKSQTISEIHFILFQKGFLEALIRVLENQRKQQGLKLSNSKIYAKTVDAISGLAFRHITQEKLIQYNVFKRILEPHSLAPKDDQKIVAVAITNMLYTSPQMKHDFINHGGIKYLQFLLSNKTKIFKRAGVKCVSLLSEHYNLLNELVKEGVIEDVMKKLMVVEFLDKEILTDILRITISQILWNIKVNLKDVVPLIEIALMVKDSLINALGLYIFCQLCLRKVMHDTIREKNVLAVICRFINGHLVKVDPEYEINIKQFIAEAFANMVRNIDMKNHLLAREIYKYLPNIFTTNSQTIVANCSFVLERLSELVENPEILIEPEIVDLIWKLLSDEESWFLVREMMWTLSLICKNRAVLKKLGKLIPSLIRHSMAETDEIRLQAMMVLAALSYEEANHEAFLKARFIEDIISKKVTSFKPHDSRYLPFIIIVANLSGNTANSMIIPPKLVALCANLMVESKSDELLFKEVCKAFANLTYLPNFEESLLESKTLDDLHDIIKNDKERSYQAFLATLIALQNITSKQEHSKALMEKGVPQDLIEITRSRAQANSADVALAIGSLANIYMSCGEVDDAVIKLILDIISDLHEQKTEITLEQRHLLASCFSFIYSVLKSCPEKMNISMQQSIITGIATKWCEYHDLFVERIILKLTLIFACKENSSTLVLSFDQYLHFILRCMTESDNFELRNDAVIAVAYMAAYSNLVQKLVHYEQYYKKLHTMFDYFPQDRDKRNVEVYFLNMLITLFKYENIRKIACTVEFSEKIVNFFAKPQAPEMYNILYKILYFMSFSECTHGIIAKDAPPPAKTGPSLDKLEGVLENLVDAYDKLDESEDSMRQCLEMLFANLSFSYHSHPALITRCILDRLKEQYQKFEKLQEVRLPVAIALINMALNTENMPLLEEDFLSYVELAKEVKGVSDTLKLRMLKAFGGYLQFVQDHMKHWKPKIFNILEDYIMSILQMEGKSDELQASAINILLNIVNSVPHGFLYFFLPLVKLLKYLLNKLASRRDVSESYYDKEGELDAKTFAINMKIIEIFLKLATFPKFFELAKNELLHELMFSIIEFGYKLTKLRKECNIEKLNILIKSILSISTDYSITNGTTAPFLDVVRKSNVVSVIISNLLVKPDIPPQINLEAFGAFANYSQYPDFLEKKELHECDPINRALIVYFAYKDAVEISHFASFLVAILQHFSQNPAFHQYLAKRQFNLLPLLLQQSENEAEVAEGGGSPTSKQSAAQTVAFTDLTKMLDVYDQLTRSSAKLVKHKELLEAICSILEESKCASQQNYAQCLAIVSNLAQNRHIVEEDKTVEIVLKALKDIHEKSMSGFLVYCPQIVSGYLRKWDDGKVSKFFEAIINLVKSLLIHSEKANVGILFRQMDKLCRPPELLNRLVQSSDILPNLCGILSGFLKTTSLPGAPTAAPINNLPRINEILNIVQYMSLIPESHAILKKSVNGGNSSTTVGHEESIIDLCMIQYKSTAETGFDGEKDGNIIKLISSVLHILRNIYKKTTVDSIKEYATKKLQQHLVHFEQARKLLESEEIIKDENIDMLIKILWAFCSIRDILVSMDGEQLCKSLANIGDCVSKFVTAKQEERAKEKVKNLLYVVMKFTKHYNSKINLNGVRELVRLCGLDPRILTTESKFELVIIMNSLNKLHDALNHKKSMQIFQLLILSNYDDPIIVYYCTEVIKKLLLSMNPELIINLWCLTPLIESLITKLKDYSSDRNSHPLLEATSNNILDSFDNLFSSEDTVQWILPTTLLSYLIYSLQNAPQTILRQRAADILLKALEYPITFPELLQIGNLNKLLRVITSRNPALKEIQQKVYALLKGIALRGKPPALAHLAETILSLSEQEDANNAKSTFIGNLLICISECCKSQGLTRDEDKKRMTDKTIETAFKAFTNIIGKKIFVKYSSDIQMYLCSNFDLYKSNSQYFLRSLHLLYKILIMSDDWKAKKKVPSEIIPFLMATLYNYSKSIEKEIRQITIPISKKNKEELGKALIGYFFERKDDQRFTEYDAHNLILSYVASILAILCKARHCAEFTVKEANFGILLQFLKQGGEKMKPQNIIAVLKIFRRVFAEEHSLEKLTNLDVGPKIIELGRLCKDAQPEIMANICKFLRVMANFSSFHPYLMTCGVLSFLKTVSNTYESDKRIAAECKAALKLYEESANTVIKLLNNHSVIQFLHALTIKLPEDQLFGYVKYLKMMLIQNFIEIKEFDGVCLQALINFVNILLESEGVVEFKEKILRETYELLGYLVPKNSEYTGMLVRREIADITFRSFTQRPNLIGDIALFYNILMTQNPDLTIPHFNQEKAIDAMNSLEYTLSNCSLQSTINLLELFTKWFSYPAYYNSLYAQDILSLLNKITFEEHLKLASPLKLFAGLIKKIVGNKILLEHATSSLNFELFRKLINSEDTSIQLTGIYPLHILTQQKESLKYIDVEIVDKLVSCAQSPVAEIRILSVSALTNILENCHNPLLVVCHQNWAFLQSIAKFLDSSSSIEKSLALRAFSLLSFDIMKMWNPLVLKIEKIQSHMAAINDTSTRLPEAIGKPNVTFEEICQGYVSAICSGVPQMQFLALMSLCSWILDSEDNLSPKVPPMKNDIRTVEGFNTAIVEAYDLEGLNYHLLGNILFHLKFPDIIAKALISSNDKAVKKAGSLALLALVYSCLPRQAIINFDLELLKREEKGSLIKLRADTNSQVFEFLKDCNSKTFYEILLGKETFTFGEEYVFNLAAYAASIENLIQTPTIDIGGKAISLAYNIMAAFFSEGQPQLKVTLANEEEISLKEVETQTNIMNAIFMSILFLTNIFLFSTSEQDLEYFSGLTIEYAFGVLEGVNPRSKYDLIALIQSYNFSYDKETLYQRELKNKHKGFEYTHRASTFFTKSIFYLIYLAFKHYKIKPNQPIISVLNKKFQTLLQAIANSTSDIDISMLYYAIQREILNISDNYISLISDGMELYLSIQCLHVLIYRYEVAAQFFVELLSFDSHKYLQFFKNTHTKVAMAEILKIEKTGEVHEKAELILKILNK